jgi:hypothetical protein
MMPMKCLEFLSDSIIGDIFFVDVNNEHICLINGCFRKFREG